MAVLRHVDISRSITRVAKVRVCVCRSLLVCLACVFGWMRGFLGLRVVHTTACITFG